MKKDIKGTVTMPLSEYNEIMQQLLKYENAIKVTKGYGDEIRCDIDVEVFREIITEKKANYPNQEKYIMRDEWYRQDFTIAELPKIEEIQE